MGGKQSKDDPYDIDEGTSSGEHARDYAKQVRATKAQRRQEREAELANKGIRLGEALQSESGKPCDGTVNVGSF